MRLNFVLEFSNYFDSVKLWRLIKNSGVNLLDTGEKIYLHGEADAETLAKVLEDCCIFGTMSGSITQSRR